MTDVEWTRDEIRGLLLAVKDCVAKGEIDVREAGDNLTAAHLGHALTMLDAIASLLNYSDDEIPPWEGGFDLPREFRWRG